MATSDPFFLKLWRLLHIFSQKKKNPLYNSHWGFFFLLRHSVKSRQKSTMISNQSNGQSFFRLNLASWLIVIPKRLKICDFFVLVFQSPIFSRDLFLFLFSFSFLKNFQIISLFLLNVLTCSQKFEGCLNLFLLLYPVCGQIWLSCLLDDHLFSCITKNENNYIFYIFKYKIINLIFISVTKRDFIFIFILF